MNKFLVKHKIKIQIVSHGLLFLILYVYGFSYLRSYLPLISPSIFLPLDQLTGYPPLINRIVSLLFALLLYLFFTLLWENEDWKKALFIQNPFLGLFTGIFWGLLLITFVWVGLIISKTIRMEGFILNIGQIRDLLFAWFITQIFNSVKEELVYRGYLLRRLASHFNKHLSVLVVSFVFAMGHFSQYQLSGAVFAFSAGLILGYLYLYYQNIYVPIGMHMIWDMASHTLLAGRIIAFQVTHVSVFKDFIIFINILFLIIFFVWKKLWLL